MKFVDTEVMIKSLTRVVMLLVLVFGLLFVLTWTGIVKCSLLPGWCDIYWGVAGQPQVLIVYGNGGLGDVELLESLLIDPSILGDGRVRPHSMHISRVNTGNLTNYALVIVEEARQISTQKLRAFMEYVNQGGRLVWTGDAGTELAPGDEYLYLDEKVEGEDVEHEILGPWARKDGDEMVNFDQFISVSYRTNFCTVKPCYAEKETYVGMLEPEPSREHPLIFGMRASLPLYVFEDEDFVIVETVSGISPNEVLSINYGSSLIWDKETEDGGGVLGTEKVNLGRTSPLIVVSGVGERIAYYAMPPELFANPKMGSEIIDGVEMTKRYFTIIENMYVGMLKG